MAKWTPPMTPRTTFEVDGQTIDAGETCVGVVRADGVAVDAATFQDRFESAIALNQLQSAVRSAVNAYETAVVMADMETGAIAVEVDQADIEAIQTIITNQFSGKNVTVQPNG